MQSGVVGGRWRCPRAPGASIIRLALGKKVYLMIVAGSSASQLRGWWHYPLEVFLVSVTQPVCELTRPL